MVEHVAVAPSVCSRHVARRLRPRALQLHAARLRGKGAGLPCPYPLLPCMLALVRVPAVGAHGVKSGIARAAASSSAEGVVRARELRQRTAPTASAGI